MRETLVAEYIVASLRRCTELQISMFKANHPQSERISGSRSPAGALG
jgi:hypothetical protein